jgi:2-polyprenyl-3-methyl-5-hydroxy-6-metoxy-1,4-benzoquinol methylase
MSGSNTIKKIEFRSLPSRIGWQARQKPLLVQAQKTYLQSRAPGISNEAYWQKFGEVFSCFRKKVEDHTMDPHVNVLLNDLGNPERSVIEYGCGVGRVADVLKARGFQNYSGIDNAEIAVKLASDRLPGMEFSVGNILTYRPARKYDAAVAAEVLLYFSPEEQINALINLNKSLKMGAPLILRWLRGENVIDYDERIIRGEKVIGWTFLATKKYIKDILEVSGFSLTRPMKPESVTLNPWSQNKKLQDYWVVFAKKNLIDFSR